MAIKKKLFQFAPLLASAGLLAAFIGPNIPISMRPFTAIGAGIVVLLYMVWNERRLRTIALGEGGWEDSRVQLARAQLAKMDSARERLPAVLRWMVVKSNAPLSIEQAKSPLIPALVSTLSVVMLATWIWYSL